MSGYNLKPTKYYSHIYYGKKGGVPEMFNCSLKNAKSESFINKHISLQRLQTGCMKSKCKYNILFRVTKLRLYFGIPCLYES